MVNIFFICLLSLLLTGCSYEKKNHSPAITEIELDLMAAENKLKLSEFVDSIAYIPLETSNLSLFGDVDRLIVTERGEYLIADKEMTNALYLFDYTGRFLRKIGNKGQGPEEYINIEDVAYYNRNIFIWDNKGGKILKYSMEGDVLCSYKCMYTAYSFTCVDEDNFVFYCDYAKNEELNIDGWYPNVIRYNPKLKQFSYDLYFDGRIPSFAYVLSLNNLSNNNLYSSMNDTIYKVYTDSITPQLVLEYKSDYTEIRDDFLESFISRPSSMNIEKKFPELISYFECNKYCIFFLYKNNFLHYAIWHAESGFCKEASSMNNPIVNDIDGIADFILRYSDGDFLYSFIEPGLLMERNFNMAKSLNICEDDNLVVVKMHVR